MQEKKKQGRTKKIKKQKNVTEKKKNWKKKQDHTVIIFLYAQPSIKHQNHDDLSCYNPDDLKPRYHPWTVANLPAQAENPKLKLSRGFLVVVPVAVPL